MSTFKDTIIDKIKSGEVAMKPKWYFVLRAFLFLCSMLFVALISVYLLTFIVFALHKTGVWFTPSFGMRGLMFLVVSSPWVLILVLFMFLGLLYVLVTHYSFSYRKPLVYSMIGSVLFVIAISSFVAQTSIHDRVQTFVEAHQVPGFTTLYDAVGKERPAGIAVGTISELVENGFVLQVDGELVTIKIGLLTRQPTGKEYSIGDKVMVLGKKTDTTMQAFGIRHLDNTTN